MTFVVNRNINFTNICYTGCRFCAFAQRKGDATRSRHRPTRSPTGRGRRTSPGDRGVHAGRIDPELPVTGYADLVRAVKARVPSMHVHAFSPDGDRQRRHRTGLGVREWLEICARAGLDTIPGTAAEIPRRRGALGADQGKLPTSLWVEIVSTAHEGRPALELDDDVRPRRHPAALGRAPQRAARHPGPHRAVSPSSCRCRSSISPRRCTWRGVAAWADPPTTGRCMRWRGSCCTAGSPTSRPAGSVGVERTQVMLNGGANDLGGTLMEETISPMAGSGTARPRRWPNWWRSLRASAGGATDHHPRQAGGLSRFRVVDFYMRRLVSVTARQRPRAWV